MNEFGCICMDGALMYNLEWLGMVNKMPCLYSSFKW